MSAHASTQVPTPDPVTESPPHDRFCDLILNGGVASGVVYPWALIELARHYRFRSIGGNSVGAVAAALAAAAEYGRCQGQTEAFEALRRAPLELAEEKGGRTGMLRLFQPPAKLRRLFDLALLGIRLGNDEGFKPGFIGAGLHRYGLGRWIVGSLALLVAVLLHHRAWLLDHPWTAAGWVVLGLLGCFCVVGLVLAIKLVFDLRALAANDYGLCSGRAQPDEPGRAPGQEAIVEWLHRGIQVSAGRGEADPPLTFGELWRVPRSGQGAAAPNERSIDLQMFSANVTLGRPVRWPQEKGETRLFFLPEEWRRIFPDRLMAAVVEAALPYAPRSESDPSLATAVDDEQAALMKNLREIPSDALPIAMAARMSLSFPILFSCVPAYAIDYEQRRGKRVLRKCLLSDGGLCTNFPIHLFEAAHPCWPTFGMMLSTRIAPYRNERLWLPCGHLAGRAENWNRSVPGADGSKPYARVGGLFSLLAGIFLTSKDWNDNITSRLPHVRNRVLRMALQDGEGQLNIAMPAARILDMAHQYGTLGGQHLVRRFVSRSDRPTRAWREHLYVRAMTELRLLRAHLKGYRSSTTAAGHTQPLEQILAEATQSRPLDAQAGNPHADPAGAKLTPAQAQAVQAAVHAVVTLEQALDRADIELGPYQPIPSPQLRSRASI